MQRQRNRIHLMLRDSWCCQFLSKALKTPLLREPFQDIRRNA